MSDSSAADPPARRPIARRRPQERQTVSIGPTESLRTRLQMNKENFSEAIGFHPSTYAGYLAKGYITKTAALAAEALIRRQQATGEPLDEVFIVRVIKGAPTAMRIDDLRKMVLDGSEYYLVPVQDG